MQMAILHKNTGIVRDVMHREIAFKEMLCIEK